MRYVRLLYFVMFIWITQYWVTMYLFLSYSCSSKTHLKRSLLLLSLHFSNLGGDTIKLSLILVSTRRWPLLFLPKTSPYPTPTNIWRNLIWSFQKLMYWNYFFQKRNALRFLMLKRDKARLLLQILINLDFYTLLYRKFWHFFKTLSK